MRLQQRRRKRVSEVEERPQRKVRLGIVTSDRMDKTVVVQITQTIRHPLYPKFQRHQNNPYAHDETNATPVGDTVPKTEKTIMLLVRRWSVKEVLERAK